MKLYRSRKMSGYRFLRYLTEMMLFTHASLRVVPHILPETPAVQGQAGVKGDICDTTREEA